MKKFIDAVAATSKNKSLKDKKTEVLLKFLENLAYERAGKNAPYNEAELFAELIATKEESDSIKRNLSDESALVSIGLYDEWNPNFAYVSGDRFTYNGNLYRVKKPNAVNPTWTPDVTHEFYEPVALLTEDGTLDNPITAVAGMSYEKGKYYAEGDKVYLCTRSDTLHYLPSALVGHYFEEVGVSNG